MLIAKLRPSVLCAISVLSLSLFGVSQTLPESKPRDIQVCELLKNPELFDEQLVRFRGQLAFEFEGDTVDDADCSMPFWHTSIWWSYGGDPLPTRQNKKITPLVLPILVTLRFKHSTNTHVFDGPCFLTDNLARSVKNAISTM